VFRSYHFINLPLIVTLSSIMTFSSLKPLALGVALSLGSSFLVAAPNVGWDLTNSFNVNSLGAGVVIGGNTPAADYKFDVPATETGTDFWKNALSTVISSDGLTAWVTWSPMGSLSFDEVMVKAANAYILWNTSGVNWAAYSGFYVTQNQIKQGQGPNASFNGISHISVNGETITRVPDSGATVLLIGLGLTGLAIVSRRRAV
jgi:hypothetical protein